MVKVGIVGTGYWGQNLVRNLNRLGVLSAICDNDSERLQSIAELYPDASSYLDLTTFLDHPELDAIVIATPAATHGELVAVALDAGKHVFVEKPLCLDLEEAKNLKAKAVSRGLVLMVGHLMLYHPAFVALKGFIERRLLGDLRYIYSTRLSLGKIRREENALWSFAPHDISMILALTNDMPTRVTANGGTYLRQGVADTSLSHFTFSSGLQAHIFVSWLHPFKDHRMVVVGSEGMIVLDDVRSGPEKLMYFPHDIGWRDEFPNVTKAEGRPIEYLDEEPLLRECQHFIDCVETGSRPETDVDEGIRVLTVLDACQKALINGKAEKVVSDA